MHELGRIGVASYDAGGATILASYIYTNNLDFIVSAQGPSIKVFNHFFDDYKKFSNIEDSKIDTLITSTSAVSSHELQVLERAKLLNIRTISILDHWVNYQERFLRNGLSTLPDEIWVTDKDAFEIASEVFNGLNIKQIKNPYKEFLKNKYSNLKQFNRKNILYCTEPIKSFTFSSENTQAILYDEFTAIELVFQKLDQINCKQTIVIKNHPTEPKFKYEYLMEKFEHLKIVISEEQDIFEELKNALFVVGCNTMALVVASWFKVPVLNAIPNGCGKSVLKLNDMKYLYSMDMQEFIDEIL